MICTWDRLHDARLLYYLQRKLFRTAGIILQDLKFFPSITGDQFTTLLTGQQSFLSNIHLKHYTTKMKLCICLFFFFIFRQRYVMDTSVKHVSQTVQAGPVLKICRLLFMKLFLFQSVDLSFPVWRLFPTSDWTGPHAREPGQTLHVT